MRRIHSDGVMVVPLYHGTSTLFGDSIAQSGLGGRDPIADLAVLDFFSIVADTCRKHLTQEEDWPLLESTIRSMQLQGVTPANFNYRHGSTYLSPSHFSACRYALDNEYGSELISAAIKFFERLTLLEKPPGVVASLLSSPLLKLREHPRQPLLIQAERVPLSFLRSESGGDALDTIKTMEFAIDEDEAMQEAFWQQTNFELVSTVPAAQLTFFLLAPSNPEDPEAPRVLGPWSPHAEAVANAWRIEK